MTIIGHRGAAGYAPENTLKSFRKAIDMGVDMVECDVRLCRSGDLVVFHDDTLDRLTGGQGRVEDLSLQELQKFDIGDGEKIPTLGDVLDLIKRRVPINIELKGINTAEPTALIINDYIKNNGWDESLFLVTSFNRKEIRKFHRINPGVRIGILVGNNPFGIIGKAMLYKAYSIHIPKPYLKKWWVRRAQKRGFRVFVFTLNSIWDIGKAKQVGVDGIFSDYPDRI